LGKLCHRYRTQAQEARRGEARASRLFHRKGGSCWRSAAFIGRSANGSQRQWIYDSSREAARLQNKSLPQEYQPRLSPNRHDVAYSLGPLRTALAFRVGASRFCRFTVYELWHYLPYRTHGLRLVLYGDLWRLAG